MTFIIIVTIIAVICVMYSNYEKAEKLKKQEAAKNKALEKHVITAKDIEESNRFMETDAFKKISDKITKINLEHIKSHCHLNDKWNRKIPIGYIFVESTQIYYKRDMDEYSSILFKFKDLGIRDLTFQQEKILEYSLGRLQGYKYEYYVRQSFESIFSYDSLSYVKAIDSYWEKQFNYYANKNQEKLKNLF